jgi:hypothetical protein
MNSKEEIEKFQFLIDYLEVAKSENDEFSRAWVALQIGLPQNTPYEEIEIKLQRTLKSSTSASKFGV